MRIVEDGDKDADLTVVIPTADADGWWVDPCIRSLRKQDGSIHTVVVESNGPGFSFPGSCNAGFALAQKDILLLNDDTWAREGFLKTLSRARGRLGEGVYQPCVKRLSTGLVSYGWRLFDRPSAALRRYLELRAPLFYVKEALAGTVEPWEPNTNPQGRFNATTLEAALITRGVLDKIGPLDERIRLGPDNIDFTLRCHLAGVNFWSVPQAVIEHVTGASRAGTSPLARESWTYFRSKWPQSRIYELVRRFGLRGRPAEWADASE